MEDCDAFIANPGGYGTALEILMAVQLKQVGLLDKPIIVVGRMWRQVMDTMGRELLSHGYISEGDPDLIHYAYTPQEAAHTLLRLTK